MITVDDITAYFTQEGIPFERIGEGNLSIHGVSALNSLEPHSMTWCKKKSNFHIGMFDTVLPLVVIAGEPLIDCPHEVVQLVVADPKAAFFAVTRRFFGKSVLKGIAKTAVVESDKVGKGVTVGHFTFIGPEVEIEDNVCIGNNVSIECPCKIGEGTVIGSGVVIGTEGYGYYADVNGILQRVPHLGGVLIGRFVDIGANVTIDRGTIGDTIIEDHVKIDNLSFVAHNVRICRSAMIVGGVTIGGSVEVCEEAYIAPGAVVMNQKRVGRRSLVGMGAVVLQDVQEGKVVMGNPARILPPMPKMTANPVWNKRKEDVQ